MSTLRERTQRPRGLGDTPTTGLRVGPDGRLYQLRTSRTTGISVAH